MTTEQMNMLVFKDQAGAYYLLPQVMLQRGRVPAEHTAEIERLIAEQQDVQGHSVAHAAATPVAVIITGGYLIWRHFYDQPLGGAIADAAQWCEQQLR